MSDVPQGLAVDHQKKVILFPEALFVLDPKQVIIRVDKQTLKMFGYENQQEIVGKNFSDLIIEQDKPSIEQTFQKILTDEHVTDLQCNAIRKDGSFLRISISGSLFVDQNGTPLQVTFVVHDITPHLSELEQVKEAERQLSEAQLIAHFGSWEWDIVTNKFQWTEEMYQLFALAPQTPVDNSSLMAHIHAEDKEKVTAFINQSLDEGKGVVDFRFINPESNAIQWFHARSKTFYDTAHKPLRIVGTVHDITHDKEIDQVKTQFLSMASHQMRGPLTTINWNAEMLLQQQAQGLTDTQKKYIQELFNASKRIVLLTNDLLTVSELELSRMPFKPEKLLLPKIAKRVLEDYERTIAEKKINFKEIYSGDLPEVMTDLFLLKTVFHQLIANAVNYTPPEGTITLSISVDPSRTNTVLISIADTGYGIPKGDQEKVFTKMFRAANAKMNVMGGTGLGLYIVKLILKLCGGEIWFNSEENKGTTFSIALPVQPKNMASAIVLP